MPALPEMIEALRGAANVAHKEDICLFLNQELCGQIADELVSREYLGRPDHRPKRLKER